MVEREKLSCISEGVKSSTKELHMSNLQYVRNPSVSLSSTLTRNEKVEHYIRIKTHKPIALRF